MFGVIQFAGHYALLWQERAIASLASQFAVLRDSWRSPPRWVSYQYNLWHHRGPISSACCSTHWKVAQQKWPSTTGTAGRFTKALAQGILHKTSEACSWAMSQYHNVYRQRCIRHLTQKPSITRFITCPGCAGQNWKKTLRKTSVPKPLQLPTWWSG